MLRFLPILLVLALVPSLAPGQFGPTNAVFNRPALTYPGPPLRVADLDGDGDQDLVTTLAGEPVILSHTGTPTSPWVLTFAASSLIQPLFWSMAETMVEDLDNDGDLDLAIAVNLGTPTQPAVSYRIFLLRNNGGMSFSLDLTLTITSALSGGGFSPRFQLAAARDITGNGFADMVFQEATTNFFTGGTNEGVRIIENTGPNAGGLLTLGTHIVLPALDNDQTNLDWDIADIDGDGDLDAVIAFGPQPAPGTLNNSGFSVWRNLSTPTSVQFVRDQIVLMPSIRKVRLADMDNDGRLDVVAQQAQGVGTNLSLDVEVHRNTTPPGGAFTYVLQSSVQAPHGYDFSIADVDCDANLDLVTSGEWTPCILPGQTQNCGPFGEMHLHPGDGLGSFLAPVALNDHGRTSLLTDLDGDNRPDLLYWRDYANDLIVRMNTGTATCPPLPLLTGTVNGGAPAGGTLTYSGTATLGFGLASPLPGIAGVPATIFINLPPDSAISAVTPILGPLGSIPGFEIAHALSFPSGVALAWGDGLGICATPFVVGGVCTPLAVNDTPFTALVPAGVFAPGEDIRLQALFASATTPLGVRASNVLRFRRQ